jgi:hypothetical protein
MVSKTSILFLLVIVAVLLILFLNSKKQTQVQLEERKAVPRVRPVYIDQPTVYLDEPIKYTEWDQEISSSL